MTHLTFFSIFNLIVIGYDVKFSVASDVPEKNIEYDNNTMRGFKWGDNSCAYDCMLTTLWIAYTTDNEEQKEILKSILPDLETCFEGMNISTDSYAPIKKPYWIHISSVQILISDD